MNRFDQKIFFLIFLTVLRAVSDDGIDSSIRFNPMKSLLKIRLGFRFLSSNRLFLKIVDLALPSRYSSRMVISLGRVYQFEPPQEMSEDNATK